MVIAPMTGTPATSRRVDWFRKVGRNWLIRKAAPRPASKAPTNTSENRRRRCGPLGVSGAVGGSITRKVSMSVAEDRSPDSLADSRLATSFW